RESRGETFVYGRYNEQEIIAALPERQHEERNSRDLDLARHDGGGGGVDLGPSARGSISDVPARRRPDQSRRQQPALAVIERGGVHPELLVLDLAGEFGVDVPDVVLVRLRRFSRPLL